MSTAGQPSELHPARVARDLGLDVPGGHVLWWESYGPNLLDAAVRAYWNRRIRVGNPVDTAAEVVDIHLPDAPKTRKTLSRRVSRATTLHTPTSGNSAVGGAA